MVVWLPRQCTPLKNMSLSSKGLQTLMESPGRVHNKVLLISRSAICHFSLRNLASPRNSAYMLVYSRENLFPKQKLRFLFLIVNRIGDRMITTMYMAESCNQSSASFPSMSFWNQWLEASFREQHLTFWGLKEQLPLGSLSGHQWCLGPCHHISCHQKVNKCQNLWK